MADVGTTEPTPCHLLSRVEEQAWFGLLRAHTVLSKEIDAALVRAHRLPLLAFEVLVSLVQSAPEGRVGMAELARVIQLSSSGTSRLVDRLEADGLVRRAAAAGDARAVDVLVTTEGRQRLDEAARTHVEVLRSIFLSRFSHEELQLLAAFWQRVGPGPPLVPGAPAAIDT